MRKILLAALIATAGIWLVIGGCRCNPKEPDDARITNWRHFIPKDSALILIRRRAAIDTNGIIRRSQLAKSYLYSEAKSMIRSMMMRDSCSGIRIYYGLTLTNRIVPIVCGVTSKGDDLYWQRPLPKRKEATDRQEAPIMADRNFEEGLCDMSQPEPPPPSANSVYLAF